MFTTTQFFQPFIHQLIFRKWYTSGEQSNPLCYLWSPTTLVPLPPVVHYHPRSPDWNSISLCSTPLPRDHRGSNPLLLMFSFCRISLRYVILFYWSACTFAFLNHESILFIIPSIHFSIYITFANFAPFSMASWRRTTQTYSFPVLK